MGQSVQQRWADAVLTVAFEDLPPVSAFPSVPGRRWGPGLWWSATTGRHVAAGSNAMRTQLMLLDRDPEVVALAGCPVRLLWHTPRGQARSWTPQLFARYRDGTALLADCPSHVDAIGERALKAGEAMEAACTDVGWTYRRLQPPDEVFTANLKWLAGYRHPRNAGQPGQRAAVLEAFCRPRPLMEGTEAVGDPIKVLPTVFHALWHGQLTTSLERPLHERAVVTTRRLGGSTDTNPPATAGHLPPGRSEGGGEASRDSGAATLAAATRPGPAPDTARGVPQVRALGCGEVS
ncbi:TnsA-like heteromeric transposase endonuclease subunit [Streptomyces sp. NBC_00568]|nr:TnsA-like heteromeric transposase endonuclease subunit [Streptomyces sp. NBC_00568]